jgi:hypothetical protein
MDSEIWFEKIGWAYIPCHWKGMAVIAAFAIPVVGASLVGDRLLATFGYADAQGVPFLIALLPALFSALAIAKRHSR